MLGQCGIFMNKNIKLIPISLKCEFCFWGCHEWVVIDYDIDWHHKVERAQSKPMPRIFSTAFASRTVLCKERRLNFLYLRGHHQWIPEIFCMRSSLTGKGGEGFITGGIRKMNSYWKLINHVEWFVSTLDIWLGCTGGLSGFVVWISLFIWVLQSSSSLTHSSLWKGSTVGWPGFAVWISVLLWMLQSSSSLTHLSFRKGSIIGCQALLSVYLFFSGCCNHHRLWNIHHFGKGPLRAS